MHKKLLKTEGKKKKSIEKWTEDMNKEFTEEKSK